MRTNTFPRCSPSAKREQGELSAKLTEGVEAYRPFNGGWNPLRLVAFAPIHPPLPRFALGEDLTLQEMYS